MSADPANSIPRLHGRFDDGKHSYYIFSNEFWSPECAEHLVLASTSRLKLSEIARRPIKNGTAGGC